MKFKCLLLLFNLILIKTIAQPQQLSIRPFLGVSQAFYSLDKDLSPKDPSFSAKNFSFFPTLNLGLSIDYKWNEKWMASTGFSNIGMGLGFSIRPGIDNKGSGARIQNTMQAYQIPLTISRFSIPRHLLFSGKEHAIQGRLITSLGISWDINSAQTLDPRNFSIRQNIVQGIANPSYTRYNNVSLHFGLGIQFYRKDGRPNTRIDLLYSKGILEQMREGVDYWHTQMTDFKKAYIYTRGSWAGIRLSYTIPALSWNKKQSE